MRNIIKIIVIVAGFFLGIYLSYIGGMKWYATGFEFDTLHKGADGNAAQSR